MEWEVRVIEWLQKYLGSLAGTLGSALSFIGGEMGLLLVVIIVLFCWKKEFGKRLAVIIVAVNGMNYGAAFGSNMLVGASGDHEGFSEGKDVVLETLRHYIEDKGITGDVKILTTGYSRSAAITNLVGRDVSDAIAEGTVEETVGNVNLEKDSAYFYSFATPNCGCPEEGDPSPTSARYSNIHYVVNQDDLVTHLPSYTAGFVRYGQMIEVDSHNDDAKDKMLWNIKRVFADYGDVLDACDFDFEAKKGVSNPADINSQLLDAYFMTLITSRDYYVDNVQDDLTVSITVLYNHPEILQDIFDRIKKEANALNVTFLKNLIGSDKATFVAKFGPVFSPYIENAGMSVYKDNIINSLYEIIKGVKHIVKAMGYDEDDVFGYMKAKNDPRVSALIDNYDSILYSHMPAMYYCYLMQADPNYAE